MPLHDISNESILTFLRNQGLTVVREPGFGSVLECWNFRIALQLACIYPERKDVLISLLMNMDFESVTFNYKIKEMRKKIENLPFKVLKYLEYWSLYLSDSLNETGATHDSVCKTFLLGLNAQNIKNNLGMLNVSDIKQYILTFLNLTDNSTALCESNARILLEATKYIFSTQISSFDNYFNRFDYYNSNEMYESKKGIKYERKQIEDSLSCELIESNDKKKSKEKQQKKQKKKSQRYECNQVKREQLNLGKKKKHYSNPKNRRR